MRIRFALLSLPLALHVGCETTQPETGNYLSNYSGFEEKAGLLGNKALVRQSNRDELERYERVIIEDVDVTARSDPDAKRRQSTRQEMERLAERFEEILKQELGKDYEITRHRSRNTLTVRAALTQLRPSQPGLFAVNYLPYAGVAASGIQLAKKEKGALGAGATSVEIEVLDSRSRRQLYGMVDELHGGKLQPGSLEKWVQSEGSMRIWARQVRRAIAKERPLAAPFTPRKEGARSGEKEKSATPLLDRLKSKEQE